MSNLVRDVSGDPAFADVVDREIDDQRMATVLFLMRNREGLTQSELARRMGCTQSRISKLERASLGSISVHDLMEYAKALGADLNIVFQKMDAATLVKHHFFQIKQHLDKIRELAGDDPEMIAGAKKFYDEWLVNTLKHFLDGKAALSGAAVEKETTAHFSITGDYDVDKELEEDLQRVT
ncbi:MAG: XRE family transcriptional regulator [Spirochaeta sp.]|nr:XRE family transcriptional regulator [Spirochaeta sp.]